MSDASKDSPSNLGRTHFLIFSSSFFPYILLLVALNCPILNLSGDEMTDIFRDRIKQVGIGHVEVR